MITYRQAADIFAEAMYPSATTEATILRPHDRFRSAFLEGVRFTLANQWVSIEDALPEKDRDILLTDGSVYFVGFHDGVRFQSLQRNQRCNPSHWTPLPPKTIDKGTREHYDPRLD